MEPGFDERLRLAAMAWLRARALVTGGPVTSAELKSFTFEGTRVPLLNQTGIWKPAVLDAALTIRTKYEPDPARRPYADEEGPDGLFRYKWRGIDGQQSDNRALRSAMRRRLPLIYFAGIAKGIYLPMYPVYLVAEEPEMHQFVVAFGDEEARLVEAAGPNVVDLREYVERVTRERLHQPVFRSRVLVAYDRRCALCRLAHPELLDAAHIRGDADGGQPVVTNGIAMCKLHHGAYDNQIVGIDPNYRIVVRHDVLEEVDGPTLRHSIQALQGEKIALPSQRSARPDRDALAERFDHFRRAG